MQYNLDYKWYNLLPATEKAKCYFNPGTCVKSNCNKFDSRSVIITILFISIAKPQKYMIEISITVG